jgi:hypothetical protein
MYLKNYLQIKTSLMLLLRPVPEAVYMWVEKADRTVALNTI